MWSRSRAGTITVFSSKMQVYELMVQDLGINNVRTVRQY